MSKSVIEVHCTCGQPLAKYEKDKKGTLQKMYLHKILVDRAGGLFNKKYAIGTEIYCPKCKKRVATIQMIHGMIAAKINHGVVKKVST